MKTGPLHHKQFKWLLTMYISQPKKALAYISWQVVTKQERNRPLDDIMHLLAHLVSLQPRMNSLKKVQRESFEILSNRNTLFLPSNNI